MSAGLDLSDELADEDSAPDSLVGDFELCGMGGPAFGPGQHDANASEQERRRAHVERVRRSRNFEPQPLPT